MNLTLWTAFPAGGAILCFGIAVGAWLCGSNYMAASFALLVVPYFVTTIIGRKIEQIKYRKHD